MFKLIHAQGTIEPEELLKHIITQLHKTCEQERIKHKPISFYLYQTGNQLYETAEHFKTKFPSEKDFELRNQIFYMTSIALNELKRAIENSGEGEYKLKEEEISQIKKELNDDEKAGKSRKDVALHYKINSTPNIERAYQDSINTIAVPSLHYLNASINHNQLDGSALFKGLYTICSFIITGSEKIPEKGKRPDFNIESSRTRLNYKLDSATIPLNYTKTQSNAEKLAKILVARILVAYTLKMQKSAIVLQHMAAHTATNQARENAENGVVLAGIKPNQGATAATKEELLALVSKQLNSTYWKKAKLKAIASYLAYIGYQLNQTAASEAPKKIKNAELLNNIFYVTCIALKDLKEILERYPETSADITADDLNERIYRNDIFQNEQANRIKQWVFDQQNNQSEEYVQEGNKWVKSELKKLEELMKSEKLMEVPQFKSLFLTCLHIRTGRENWGDLPIQQNFEVEGHTIILNYKNQKNPEKLAKILVAGSLIAYAKKMMGSKIVLDRLQKAG